MIPLYLIFSKVNEYFEEIDWNKYLVLVPINENNNNKKNTLKNMNNFGLYF